MRVSEASALPTPPNQAAPAGGTAPGPGPVVGVFDSGVGGLSVLPALRQALPTARLLVVADSGHAPYGERDDAWIEARCLAVSNFLRRQGAHLMVLACNTATAVAADALRTVHGAWPIVGIEPGVKPAVKQSASGRIGVMATSATLRSGRYARLIAEHGQGASVMAQACTGLALAIEKADENEIGRLVDTHTLKFREAGVDTVVLGCTHYPFARRWIEAVMGPEVHILDTAEAVARRAASLVDEQASDHMRAPRVDEASMAFWTSGDPTTFEAFAQRWLGWSIRAQLLDASAGSPGATTTNR